MYSLENSQFIVQCCNYWSLNEYETKFYQIMFPAAGDSCYGQSFNGSHSKTSVFLDYCIHFSVSAMAAPQCLCLCSKLLCNKCVVQSFMKMGQRSGEMGY